MTTYFNDLDSKSLQVDNIRIDGNAITSTNTNGNISITPNGTGRTTSTKSFDITGLKNNFFWNGVKNNDSTSTGSNITLPALEYLFTYLTNNSLVSIKEISIGNGNFGILYNATSNNITLQNQNGATPEIGIITGTGADLVLKPGQSVILYNEAVDIQGWIVLSSSSQLNFNEFIDSTTTGSNQLLNIPTSFNKIILTDSGLVSIDGISIAEPGYPLILVNNTGNTIEIVNNSGTVLATEKILTGTGNNLELDDNAALLFNYNGNDNLWNIVGGAGGGGGFAEAFEETIDTTSTGAVLDFNPVTTKTVFTDAGLTSIRSIVAPPVPGTICVLVDNTGSGFTLVHEDLGATAANRLSLPRNKNFTLRESEAVILSYNGNINRWETLDINTQYTDLRITSDLRLDGLLRLDESTSASTGTAQTIAVPTTGVLTLTDADLESVEGLSGATANQMLLLVNQTGRTITLLNESGTAANQIVTGEGQDSLMADGSSVWLYYGDNTKWNKVGNNNVNIPLIGNWSTYTPTISTDSGSLPSRSSEVFKYRVDGPDMLITGRVAFSGTGSGSGFYQFTLPSGYTIRTSVMSNSNFDSLGVYGVGGWYDQSTSPQGTIIPSGNGTSNGIKFTGGGTTTLQPTNATIASGDFFNFTIRVSVNELSQNTISGLAAQSTLAYGLAGQTTNQTINTTPAVIQYNNSSFNYKVSGSGITWNNSSYRWEFTRAMRVNVFACVTIQATVTNLEINIRKNGVNQAIQLGDSSDTSSVNISYPIDVVSGDNIDITAVTASGSTTTSNNASRSYVIIQEVPFSTTSIATGAVYLGSETWVDSEANATTTAYITRMGPKIVVDLYSPVTGSFSGGDYNVTIPSVYAASTIVYQNVSTTRPYIGQASLSDSGATYSVACVLTSTTNIRIYSNNSGANSNITSTSPFTWANGDYITAQLSWYVQGW